MTAKVRDLITDPEAPYGRAPEGHAFTEHEYEERFNQLGPNGEPYANFPGNDGAVPGSKVAFNDLDHYKEHYGSLLDRIGKDDGKYLGVVGENGPASWEERAMHVNSLRDPYNGYTLRELPEGWKIEVSQIGPGVGQPGGGLQVRILSEDGEVVRVKDLIEYEILGRR